MKPARRSTNKKPAAPAGGGEPLADRVKAAEVTFTSPDGQKRSCWPTIVEYEAHDGARHAMPPPGRYKIVVHDLERYDHLCATGELYSPEHRGTRSNMVDNRTAPGA